MSPFLKALLPGVGEVVGKVFDRVFPDPETRRQAEMEVAAMAQRGEFRQLDSLDNSDRNQAEVNKVEAASDNLFKSGWRPAVGWVCVLALASQYFFVPLLTWVAANELGWSAPPEMDWSELLTLLLGMLGLGAYRTYEKTRK